MYKILLTILFCTLVACSTKNISIAPTKNLKLVGDSVIVKVVGDGIDAKVLDKLTREIKVLLVLAGFDIDKTTNNQIKLNVAVSEFTPGNAALRITFGFGAGRGSLLYTAEYKNQAGQTLAKMDGQERFTGEEISFNQDYGGITNLGGEETATEVLIKEAARHIVELAKLP